MAITRSQLILNVARNLVREDVAENGIAASWVPLATARINQELRINEMLAHVVQPLLKPRFMLPFNFIAVKTIGVNTTVNGQILGEFKDPLVYCPPENVKARCREMQNNGWPQLYTIFNREVEIAPYRIIPGLQIDLRYYAELPPLVNDTDTNIVLARYPDIYNMAMMIYGHRYLMEMPQSREYENLLSEEMARLMTKKEVEKYGEGALIVRPTRRIGGRFS